MSAEVIVPVGERADRAATPPTAGGPPRYFALSEPGPGVLLAGTCGRGVARSNDGGSTWAPATGAVSGCNVCAFTTGPGGLLYAAAGDAGFVASVDLGASWSPVAGLGGWVYCLGVDGDELIAGTTDGVMRCSASGTWSPDRNGPRSDVYRLVPLASGGLAAATEASGVWIRGVDTDWTPIGLADQPVFALVELDGGDLLAGTRGAGIARWSRSQGAWRPVGCQPADLTVHAIARSADGSLFAGTGQGVVRAGADGERWLQLGASLGQHRIFSVLASAAGDVFAGSYDGIWVLPSAATDWRRVGTGLDLDEALTIAVDVVGVAHAGGSAGVFRSTDGGRTWTPIRPDVDIGNAYCFGRSHESLYVGTDDGLWHAGRGMPGERWSRAGLDGARVFTLIELEPGHLVAGTLGSGVWARPEAASDWHRCDVGLDHPLAFDLMRSPSTGELFVATGVVERGAKSGGIFRSADGERWEPASLEQNTVYDLVETSAGVIVGGAQRCRILRSSDGGRSFVTTRPEGRHESKMYCLMVDRGDHLYLGAGSELLRSDDTGASWQVIGHGLDGVTVFGLAGFDDGSLLAATSSGVYRSVDTGVTWTSSPWSA